MDFRKISFILNTLVISNSVQNVGMDFVSASEAKHHCSNISGLVNYTQLRDIGSFDYLEQDTFDRIGLQDGQSAWIYGTVKFTEPVLSFHGCGILKQNQYVPSTQIEQNYFALYRCVDMCGKTDSIKSNLSHIGIGHLTNWTTRICYCFVGFQFTSQPPSMCTHYIPNLSTYKKNENHRDILSVYRVHERSWTSGTTSSAYACLKAKLETTNGNNMHEELPCYAKPKSHDIGGIVCANISGELSDKLACTIEKHGRYHYCYVARSFTLPSARSYCFNISGDLLPFFRKEIKELFPNITHSFWTGSFRAFKVTDHADTIHVGSESCLAVTRIGTRLYLDPDDCSTRKRFVCTDDLLVDTVIPPNHSDPGFNNVYIVYICAAVLATILSAVVAVFVIRKFGSRRKVNTSPAGIEDANREVNSDPNDARPNQIDQSLYAVSNQVDGANKSAKVSSDDYDHICHKENKQSFAKRPDDGNVYGYPKEFNMNAEYDVLNYHGITKVLSNVPHRATNCEGNVYGYSEGQVTSNDYDVMNCRGVNKGQPNEQYSVNNVYDSTEGVKQTVR
ncbi:hypothetical protein ACF0H5_015646 [Mactra antiquata]